jgi:hypothetical protein
MSSGTMTANRVLNGLLVGSMVFRVFGTSSGEASVQKMFLDIGVLLSFILIYVIAYFFLMRFGQFFEIEPEETVQVSGPAGAAPEQPADTADQTASDKAAYTQEQLDLMALYESYAKEASDQGDAGLGATRQDALSAQAIDTCEHVPTTSWKNYIPTQFHLTCAKCGAPITFTQGTKRSINLILMVVVFLILMPNFMNTAINVWQYVLLAVLCLVIGVGVQYYFLRHSTFIKSGIEAGKR